MSEPSLAQNVFINNDQPIKLSVSHHFHNKENVLGKKRAYGTFQADEMTEQAFVNHVISGKAFCPAFLNKDYRKKQNFQSAQVIALDFDVNASVQSLLAHPFIKKHAALVYPTPSSTPESPRSRVVFILAELVNSMKIYEDLVARLLQLFPMADPACKDAARMFYGSNVSGYVHQQGKRLPLTVLRELPEPESKTHDSRKRHNNRGHSGAKKTQQSSSELDSLEMLIRSALETIPKQQHYLDWVRCLMAVHSVFPNDTGVQLIEGWSPGFDGEIAEKFASFSPGSGVGIGTLFFMARQNGWNPPILQDEIETKSNRVVINERYITNANLDLKNRVSLICSAMATGKTELANRLITEMETELGRPLRILYLVHRISLAKNAAKRLGFNCYLDFDERNLAHIDQLVCTPNSIKRITDSNGFVAAYDVLIIDESDQLARHLFGETMGGNSGLIAYNIIQHLIGNTPTVVAMDAYASKVSYKLLETASREVQVIHNEYQPFQGQMRITGQKEGILASIEFYLDERQDLPLILLFDEKAVAEEMYEFFKHKTSDIMLLHGDNTSDPDQKRFLENIDQEIMLYDLVISTTVLGTGVDIQADVKKVSAIFRGRVIPADEMMQFLGRFRRASEFVVNLPEIHGGNRETNAQKIHDEYLDQETKTWMYYRVNDKGQLTIDDDQKKFFELYTVVQSHTNEMLNKASAYFAALASKRYNIESGELIQPDYDEELDEASEIRKLKTRDRIMTAKPVDKQEYRTLSAKNEATSEVNAGYTRWRIEDTYGGEISLETYDHWKNGGGRTQLLRFLSLMLPDAVAEEHDEHEKKERYAIHKKGHYKRSRILYRTLLEAIWVDEVNCVPIPENEFLMRLNGTFASITQIYKAEVKFLLDYRGDMENPYNILQCLMKRLGLSLRKQRVGKQKNRIQYQILPEKWQQMMKFAQSHAKYHKLEGDFTRITLDY